MKFIDLFQICYISLLPNFPILSSKVWFFSILKQVMFAWPCISSKLIYSSNNDSLGGTAKYPIRLYEGNIFCSSSVLPIHWKQTVRKKLHSLLASKRVHLSSVYSKLILHLQSCFEFIHESSKCKLKFSIILTVKSLSIIILSHLVWAISITFLQYSS